MAQHLSKKRNTWKWVLGSFTALILIIGGLALYFSAKWKPVIRSKIEESVRRGSGGLYHLRFKDVHLNLVTGTASLDQMVLEPDTQVFNRMKSRGVAPVHLFHIAVKKLQVNRVSLLTAYFKRKIDVNSIVLEQPDIRVVRNLVRKRPDTATKDSTLYQLISKSLKTIRVGAIRIKDAGVAYEDTRKPVSIHAIKHLNIQVKDLLIDSLSQYDTTRFYYTRDVNFELTGYQSKSKMYVVKLDTVSGSTLEKRFRMKGLKMIPRYPDLAFSRMHKYGKDRYDLAFEEILMKGVDFVKLNTEGSINAKSLTIGPAKTGIFLNREMPAPPGLDKGKNFPQMAFKRLSIPVSLDTVRLKGIDVAYTEYNPISQERGTIYFQHLNGNILGLTNDSLALSKKHHAIATLHAQAMKIAPIDIRLDFNLSDALGAFNYSGTIGAIDLKQLNPVSKPLGLIEIESGNMQKTDFNINGNTKGSSGIVHFYYTNLKLKLLKEGENGEAPKKKGLLSFLANTLLINDDNPTKGEQARTAKVTFVRSPAASFFNLLWKGLFIGMRETAGLGIVPVKSPEEGMKKIREKKKERQQKKTNRHKGQTRFKEDGESMMAVL